MARRLEARPVGANKAMESLSFLPIFVYKSTIALIIVVLPTPGPPVIITNF